jgi:Fe-S oxidoreductase
MSTPTPTGVGAATPRVGFFVTCLTDLFRPNVGFAAVRLLEQAGCSVTVPEKSAVTARHVVGIAPISRMNGYSRR